MIKGVNKKVLEINNPQSIYFEKAVLYLKPNMNSVSYKLLRTEAEEMLGTMSPKKPKLMPLRYFLTAVLMFSTGFLGTFTAYRIFFC